MLKWWLITLVAALDPQTHQVALVTYHGGLGKKEINNIDKYEFAANPDNWEPAGHLLNNQDALDLHGIRGMAYVPQKDELYFVNAYRLDSKLLLASGVSTGNASAQVLNNANLQHPYGIAISNDTWIYITNQNSNQVTKYSVQQLAIRYPVFARVGDPRGLAVDQYNNVWIADKVANSVMRFNPQGMATMQVPASWPIGVTIFDNQVFVSSRDGPAAVLVYDVNTGRSRGNYSSSAISLPCGLVIHNASNSLFLMTQNPPRVHRFKYLERTYVGPVTDVLPDIPQQIVLVDMLSLPPPSKKKGNNKKSSKKKKGGNSKKSG